MKRHVIVIILLLIPLLSAAHAGAAGKAILHLRSSGQSAQANFITQDSACIYTTVAVIANKGPTEEEATATSTTASATIAISEYDSCADTSLEYARGFAAIPETAFQVKANLSSATLHATIPEVTDDRSGATYPVTIDVTWASVGRTYQQKGVEQFHWADGKAMSHLNGKFRDAAATGAVTGPHGTLNPDTPGYGTISDLKWGEWWVYPPES